VTCRKGPQTSEPSTFSETWEEGSKKIWSKRVLGISALAKLKGGELTKDIKRTSFTHGKMH